MAASASAAAARDNKQILTIEETIDASRFAPGEVVHLAMHSRRLLVLEGADAKSVAAQVEDYYDMVYSHLKATGRLHVSDDESDQG